MRSFVLLSTALSISSCSGAVFFKPNPIPDNYVEWTATTYSEGDGTSSYSGSTDSELVFWWESGTQDVWQMYDETSWKNCDFAYATQLTEPLKSEGSYVEAAVDLSAFKPGTYYWAAGVGAHCDAGQKLIVTIWDNPLSNEQTGWNSFIGAGAANVASGDWSTIGGGYNNKATGMSSTVLGGISNACVSNYATITGGYNNMASSRFATVLGGARNTARGRYSLAAGFQARTTEDYSAAFGFNGKECTAETAKTVAFCADHFYINDVDILADLGSRRLREEAMSAQKSSLAEIESIVQQHEETIYKLAPAIQRQEEAFQTLERIEEMLGVVSAK
mmetsp:Transcript_25048/g.36797  ORF Transcript_25048/g.36797 Transcript_25048/m.36797 type:complete len:333 (+) Transcript_25048:132-1130(+)|eukprot:CAMPEP_0195522566 /NCGR_PEP_ID=MMETSP0794_2-20130614/20846_1 /TAXON_ID=515487 /ORGANISM="Stephanopyxis turris, Strain CCMP 815" /LENGTH=332 /DNA_ID=CAMNT_0040652349 /DNA_START=114 /DNA_END=1112 /DNA_ORIENTATION=+